MTAPRAALVTVGDELLLGSTVDTNAAWIGQALAAWGVPVVRRYTVADDAGEIRRAVSEATALAELTLVTGGLGPTPDDLTRDVVADLFGCPLEEDAEILAALRTRAAQRGLADIAAPNRRVAQVPRGAAKLHNALGTAPGLALEQGGRLVVLLPGVPREMKAIFSGPVLELLTTRFSAGLRPVHTRLVHTTGIPESLLAERVAAHLPSGGSPLSLAFLPDLRGVDLRMTALEMDAAGAQALFDQAERALEPVLSPWRFHASTGDLAEAVVRALRAAGHRVAVAESCTGGLISKRLTDVPGASEVLSGGVVAYANAVKTGLLGVDPSVITGDGAVSEAVATAMARGVAEALGCPVGLGITGVAGPGGGTPEKPVGTVWYACALNQHVVARRERFPGDREEVRERAAQAALFLLLRLLDGREAHLEGGAGG